MIWDNPSKTVIEPGFNEQTRWTSEVGDRVSFFVIAGNTFDEIYTGYRLLTGARPMLPKAAYGYIQSDGGRLLGRRQAATDDQRRIVGGFSG